MPTLDPSRVILSPRLADRFTVVRRQQIAQPNGRPKKVQTSFPNVVGVVTYASPNDLERLPDEERAKQSIRVHTRFRLFAPARDVVQQTFLPDLVLWDGDFFVVADLNRYSRYGAGFLDAICCSMDVVDTPASYLPAVVGQLDFSRPNQSFNLAFGARPC